MKNSNVSVFLRSLAVVDSLALLIKVPNAWYFGMFGTYLDDLDWWLCKFYAFLTSIFMDLSGWILSLFAIDRLICTHLPCRYKLLLTKRVIVTALIMASLFTVLVNLVLPLTAFYDKDIPVCHFILDGMFIWQIADFLKYCVLPFLIILCCNIAIIRDLVRTVLYRRQHLNLQSTQPAISRTYILLISVSFSYLLLTAPTSIYSLIINTIWANFSWKKYARIYLFRAFAILFTTLNHSCNFFLYCMSGKTFRGELKHLFQKSCCRHEE